MTAEVENNIVAVERIKEYTVTPQVKLLICHLDIYRLKIVSVIIKGKKDKIVLRPYLSIVNFMSHINFFKFHPLSSA